MTEKAMHPDHKSDATGEQNEKAKPQPGTRAGPPSGDARRDEEQLHKNQEQLRVGRDHKTPEMKKGHRGTFP